MRLNVEQQSRNHYSQKELNSLTPPWIDLPLNDLTFPRTITVTLYYESLRPLRRAKSRVLIPEYKWHFQEHASDRPSRTNRRRLTGSICNILSRDGRKGRERERERERSIPQCESVCTWSRDCTFRFFTLATRHSLAKGRSLCEKWPHLLVGADLILTDHVAFGHSSSNPSYNSRLFRLPIFVEIKR